MGLFKKDPLKVIFEDYDRTDCEDILETAKAISGNYRRVTADINEALNDPKKFVKQNAKRFDERFIDINDEEIIDELDADEMLFLAMLDELEAFDYAFEFDWKCALEDFLWGLSQIKNYDLIKDVVRKLELNEEDNIEQWGKQINKALDGTAYICYMHIDSDSYPLTIVSPEAFEKIPLPFITVM